MATRHCPCCKAEIEADARKCRYCREWVSSWYAASRWIWIAPILVLAWTVAALLYNQVAFSEAKFWQHPESLRVTSHHPATQDGYMVVLAAVKNVSARPWKYITVQADYYDKQNQLVDSGQGLMRDTLPPGQERACKVQVGKTIAGANYDHYRAFVAGAYDASRRP